MNNNKTHELIHEREAPNCILPASISESFNLLAKYGDLSKKVTIDVYLFGNKSKIIMYISIFGSI